MSNRRRRLLRKLANLPVSREEKKRRAVQRLVAETEARMVPVVRPRPEGIFEGILTTANAVTKKDIDSLALAAAAAAQVPVQYFMPEAAIQGLKADQVFIDDPMKEMEEAPTPFVVTSVGRGSFTLELEDDKTMPSKVE